MEDCIFCKIVAGVVPSRKVFEDDDVYAFYDIHPSAPVHVLIIPKKHIAMLGQAEDSDLKVLGKIQIVAKKIAFDLKIGDAFKLQTSSGQKAGQEVFHLHYHLKGGWSDERGDN